MRVPILSVAELGLIVRAVRRSSHVRLDDLAATTGVSKQFAADLEHGKPTIQMGLVLKLLAELGVPLHIDIPDATVPELTALRLKGGVAPPKKRAPSAASVAPIKAKRKVARSVD